VNLLRIGPLLLAAAICAAGCGSTVGTQPVGFDTPMAAAVFHGLTSKNASDARHPYVAVANTGRHDLVLVDAIDDAPVLAPILIRSLGVPLAGLPTLVAATSLADEKPDLLVALSAGSSVVQVVNTWSVDNGAAAEVDLAAVAPGEQVLAVLALPVPDGAGVLVAGQARVLVALTGGKLAVIPFARAASPDDSISPGEVSIRELGFDAVSLAVGFDPVDVDPAADLVHVYAASPDPIPGASGTAEGVAELDVSVSVTDPQAWTVEALAARAPTRLVAAGRLKERVPGAGKDDVFQAEAVRRVYAVLDEGRCGRLAEIQCGIAVLDPATRKLVADPTAGLADNSTAHPDRAMPYLAPIRIPATPLALTFSGPPATSPASTTDPAHVSGPDRMLIRPASGARETTGVLAVPAGDGRVYFVDAARWSVPNDVSILTENPEKPTITRTQVTFVQAFAPGDPEGVITGNPVPAVQEDGTSEPLIEGAIATRSVHVTPGFTDTDSWQMTYQGVLPGLSAKRVEGGTTGGGSTWIALQTRTSGGAVAAVTRVWDPQLFVHAGDIVQLTPVGDLPDPGAPGTVLCPAGTAFETTISALIPPDAGRPGGALELRTPTCGTGPSDAEVACRNTAACVALVGSSPDVPVLATLRAPEFLLTGSIAGYAGRYSVITPQSVVVQYEPQADALGCEIFPWPDDLAAAASCDDGCRSQCERMFLSRKARRIYHVSTSCTSIDLTTASDIRAACVASWPTAEYPFPDLNGPVLRFILTLYSPSDSSASVPDRDSFLRIDTLNGIVGSSRAPPSTGGSAIFPANAARFDRSRYEGKEAAMYRFYVPYADGHLLDFSPGEVQSLTKVIR
jgi:hypothetical protein